MPGAGEAAADSMGTRAVFAMVVLTVNVPS